MAWRSADLSPCMSALAASKCTKAGPAMRKLALATNVLGVLRRVFAHKLKGDGQLVSGKSGMHVDAVIGAPRDAVRHWRKVGHNTMSRSCTILLHRGSEYVPLVWLCV